MAVTTDVRRTGTILQIIDDHLNDWTDFAGQDINIPTVYQTYTDEQSDTDPDTYPPEYDQKHWSYRGQAAMLALPETWQVAIGTLLTGLTNINGSALTGYTNRSSGFTLARFGAWDSNGATTGIVQRTITLTGGSEANAGRTLELVAANPGTPISYVGGADANATTIALPVGTAVGDLMIVTTTRANTTGSTIPTPTDTWDSWTDMGVITATGYSQRVACKRVTATDLARGDVDVWANAVSTMVLVYRNATIHGIDTGNSTVSSTLTFPAQSGLIGASQIIRCRIGDGITAADRTVYRQIITDPTVASQWTTWAQLYTGDHFALALELVYAPETQTSYRVITSKSDGIYVNNVSEVGITGVVKIKPVLFRSGEWRYQVVSQDTDDNRRLDWYIHVYLSGIVIGDAANYRWYRYDQVAVYYNHPEYGNLDWTDSMYVTRAFAETHARSQIASEVLTSAHAQRNEDGGYNQWKNIDYIKGPSGQAGYKWIENLTYVPDTGFGFDGSGFGYWYLFYNEQHHDRPGNNLANLLNPLFWSRGWNLPAEKWSDAVPVGYSVWGFAGAAFFGSYMYVAGNGRVLRRPIASTTLDLSDYVVEGDYDLPRGSQPASARITCANPDNVLGLQLGLTGTAEAGYTEYRANLQMGLLHPGDTAWTWKSDALWWTAAYERNNDSDQERVIVTLGDAWHRLDNEFREAIYLPGHFDWADWLVGGTFRTEMYHNDDFEYYAIDSGLSDGAKYLTVLGGDTVFTGWRGENGFVFAKFQSPATTGRLVFRYQDKDNYYYAERTSTQVRIGVVKDGAAPLVLSYTNVGLTTSFFFGVSFRWSQITVYYNYTQVLYYNLPNPETFVGFAGVGAVSDAPFTVSNFQVTDYNRLLKTSTLIAKLLAFADTGTALTSNSGWTITSEAAQSDQLDTIWAPQSDLNTPAKALQQLLTADGLELIYTPEPTIGRFDVNEDDVEFTIQNEIIRQSHVNNGKGRPNIVVVDGQENSWTEYDRTDLLNRQRPVAHYIDAPELLTPGDVRARAEKEILDARRYNSPGGDVVWQPWFNRLDPYYWIDEAGQQFLTRIEGMRVSWNQSTDPFQRVELDMGAFIICPPTTAPASYIARDTFQRTVASGLGTAQIGGAWTIT